MDAGWTPGDSAPPPKGHRKPAAHHTHMGEMGECDPRLPQNRAVVAELARRGEMRCGAEAGAAALLRRAVGGVSLGY